MKVIIDTNIILDVILNREPFTMSSAEVLRLSENRFIAGLITANTVTDIYYILNKHFKNAEKVKAIILKLLSVVEVADVLGDDIIRAFSLPIDDFEDALLVQCAIRSKSSYIITRNLKDYIHSPIPTVSPQALLEMAAPKIR